MSKARVVLSPSKEGPTVDPNVYGQFAEHIGRCIYEGIWVGEKSSIPNDGGIRLDTVKALRDLELPILRWPGGCFADMYHWRDGIGPRDKRPGRQNIHWASEESNQFGTHEFIKFCKMIGTEPCICANVGSGSPEEAQSWVEYCNATQDTALARERAANGDPEPFNVKYWDVGNEPWGCGGHFTPERYADLYRQFATFMRGRTSGVKLVAGGSHNGLPEWDIDFLRALKPHYGLVDVLGIHCYSGGGVELDYSKDDYYGLMASVKVMDRHIELTQYAIARECPPDRRPKIAMDEWGTWYKEANSTTGWFQASSMRDAIFTALTFHMFHTHAGHLVMTNMAQTVNILQSLIQTKGKKLCLTPTYWIYEMFKPHKGGKFVHLNSRGSHIIIDGGRSAPLFSASATMKEDSIAISLVNVDLEDSAEVELSVEDVSKFKVKSARVLTSPDVHDHNTPEKPDVIKPPADLDVSVKAGTLKTVLPPCSVAVVELAVPGR